ncbi:MAG: dihydrolipoamide acetyltransferase family protein, partial [Anaerolineae bacterium]|nr:dihydrolipoamide acetyltransferase family protein [Anaerolineae bacterium]
MAVDIKLPEMGEGIIEATIARWLKQEGEVVTAHDPIVEIETDKVTTEMVAETDGTLLKILASEGETVEVGAVIAVVGEPGETVTTNGNEPVQSKDFLAVPEPVAEEAADSADGNGSAKAKKSPRISPVVARMIKEHNLDISQIPGTGRHERVTKKDVEAYLARSEVAAPASEPEAPALAEPAPAPAQAVSPPPVQPGAADTVTPLSSMRRAIADHMVLSKRTSPHVTTVFEADFSAVMAHRRQHKAEFAKKGINLTLTPYIFCVVAQALRRHPQVNSSWSEQGLLLKQQINLGMAVSIPDGLIVPVLKHADELNLSGLARQVNDLADRARANRLQPDEVQGGTFTITNHGVSGSLFATPIINQPQCGILGVGKIEKRVVVITDDQGNDLIAVRPLAYLSFTFDHRILDGA